MYICGKQDPRVSRQALGSNNQQEVCIRVRSRVAEFQLRQGSHGSDQCHVFDHFLSRRTNCFGIKTFYKIWSLSICTYTGSVCFGLFQFSVTVSGTMQMAFSCEMLFLPPNANFVFLPFHNCLSKFQRGQSFRNTFLVRLVSLESTKIVIQISRCFYHFEG